MGLRPLPRGEGGPRPALSPARQLTGPGEGSLAHLGPTSAIITPMASRTLRTNSSASFNPNPFGIRSKPMPRLLKKSFSSPFCQLPLGGLAFSSYLFSSAPLRLSASFFLPLQGH